MYFETKQKQYLLWYCFLLRLKIHQLGSYTCFIIISPKTAYPSNGSLTITCVTVRSDELLKVRLNGQSHLLQSIVANKFLFPIYDYLAYIFLSIISLKGWNLKYISICLS